MEVCCFAQHYSVVMTTYLQYKERLRENDQTILDFASMIKPFAVTDLDIIKQNDDLIVPGRFSEPDSFFLSRQERAYSSEAAI